MKKSISHVKYNTSSYVNTPEASVSIQVHMKGYFFVFLDHETVTASHEDIRTHACIYNVHVLWYTK